MDGLEVVKKIRAAGILVPIVILSSHTEQEYLWRAVELKITRYLPKPYDKNAFIKALQDVAAELINHAPIFSINDELKYDFAKKIIYVKDSACHLSKSESKLLEYFLARKKSNRNLRADYSTICGSSSSPARRRSRRSSKSCAARSART